MFYGVGVSIQLDTQGYPHTNCVRTPNRGGGCGVYSIPHYLGEGKTKDHIIKREILHSMHAPVDSLVMLEDINRLYNLGIFSTVDIVIGDGFCDDLNQQTANYYDYQARYNINVVESFAMLPDLVIDYNENLIASVGKVVETGKILIMGNNKEVRTDEIGELWISGPMVIPGYWNDLNKTSIEFVNGYWKSGDIGYKDKNNYIYILDRKKDVINRGGYNIYSSEFLAQRLLFQIH